MPALLPPVIQLQSCTLRWLTEAWGNVIGALRAYSDGGLVKALQYEPLIMQPRFRTRYIPFIALPLLALLLALWAGLLRMGWRLPAISGLALAHGPLMVAGFVGALIALERAVAIRMKWMFAVPAISALGSFILLLYQIIGAWLITAGSLGTVAILGVMLRRELKIHTAAMAIGALAWAFGNILWLSGMPIFQVVPWWQAFLILTIGGERLELSRVLRASTAQVRLFVVAVAGLLAGAIVSIFTLDVGARLFGIALLVLSLWFMRNDIARPNIRHPAALTRYMAFCLYAGFIWMGIGGMIQLYLGAVYAGPLYDAALHSIFVGFVISMIFGHAPMIFPAILGVPITFSRAFYAQLVLLHLSLIVRITGDLSGALLLRQWGGLLNEVAILLFLGTTMLSLIWGRTQSVSDTSR